MIDPDLEYFQRIAAEGKSGQADVDPDLAYFEKIAAEGKAPEKPGLASRAMGALSKGMFGDPRLIEGGIEGIAKAGRFGVKQYKRLAEAQAEAAGRLGGPALGIPAALGGAIGETAVETIIPQDKTGVALSLLGPMSKLAGGATKAIGPAIKQATRVVKPGAVAKVGGSLISASTAVPQRYAQAVLADASILGKETPSMLEVGKEYQEAFKKAGMKIDSELYQRLTRKRFPPTDSEVGKLKDLVENALDKLEAGTLREEEAFVARSAASAIERSNQAMSNPRWKSVASGAKDSFDNLLENSSMPNIRDLSHKYFKAAAKEQFESWLPKNKNMSPNALRSLIMANLGVGAAGSALTGNIIPAAVMGVKAAAMSPKVVGGTIKAAAKAGRAAKAIVGPTAQRAAGPAYNVIRLLSPSGQEQETTPEMADRLREKGWKDAP